MNVHVLYYYVTFPFHRNEKSHVENERNHQQNILQANQLSFQNIFQSVTNFARSKYVFISSLFSKPKRRRPYKKPVELNDPNLLKRQSEVLQNSTPHAIMTSSNNISKRKLSKELSSGDKNTSQMLLRKRNTALVYSETHPNNNKKNSHKLKHSNYHSYNDSNHDAPSGTHSLAPEVDTFDPVMIAKMSAQARGRNSKRESSSSCGSAESVESTPGRKGKEDSNRKKQKSKNHQKGWLLSS